LVADPSKAELAISTRFTPNLQILSTKYRTSAFGQLSPNSQLQRTTNYKLRTKNAPHFSLFFSFFPKNVPIFRNFSPFFAIFLTFSPFFSYLFCPNPTLCHANPHFQPKDLAHLIGKSLLILQKPAFAPKKLKILKFSEKFLFFCIFILIFTVIC